MSSFGFGNDSASNSAILTLNNSGVVLGNGDSRSRIGNATVADLLGRSNSGAYTYDFTVLSGDANFDRKVDFLACRFLYNTTAKLARRSPQDNFDSFADGSVSFADLLLLAQNEVTTLIVGD